MDGHKHEGLIDDDALAQEIEAALRVEPSPEFLPKVRARIADERGDGGWTWSIPWRFQVGSGASKVFTTVDQVVSITAAGAATISKAGASNHSERNDATEIGPKFSN